MAPAHYHTGEAFTSASAAAAVICRTPHGNLHIGVLHGARSATSALHLGWLDDVGTDWPWGGLWASPKAPPEKLVLAAAVARRVLRVYQRTGRFPYALGDVDSTFAPSGELELTDGSLGLTCATFVLAIFRTAGIDLVDFADWPVRVEADQAFLRHVRGFASAAHLRALEAQVEQGICRLHPHEAMAACLADHAPSTFPELQGVALEVSERL